jgi:hypothetical protein
MAKKDLTPYQQARRQFVQARVQKRGVAGTPEERKKFRQRFDVLAQTVEGRGKIARNVMPEASQEDRKSFRRMLATEMPARKTGTGTKSTTSTPPTPPSYTQQQITAMRTAASTYGPQLAQVKNPPAGSFGATQKVSSTYSTGIRAAKKPSTAQKISNAISTPGSFYNIPGLSRVAQSRKEFDKGNIIGGLGRLALGTAETALTVGSIVGILTGMGGSSKSAVESPLSGPKTKPTRPTPPSRTVSKVSKASKSAKTSKASKVAKVEPVKVEPTPSKAVTPKTKTVTPKAKTVTPKAKTVTPKQMPKETLKVKGEEIKVADTVSERTATPSATKTPKASKTPKATSQKSTSTPENLPLNFKATYKFATEADKPFLEKLSRAQEEIAKNGPAARQYSVWLNAPMNQKILRRLKTGK